jgi:hypothetical protein
MICTATLSGTFCLTGTGWYGEPGQHGWDTCALHSRTFSVSSLCDMPSRLASRCSTAAPPSGCAARSIMFTVTTSELALSASGWPPSSRILPRTAGVITVCVWSWAASRA